MLKSVSNTAWKDRLWGTIVLKHGMLLCVSASSHAWVPRLIIVMISLPLVTSQEAKEHLKDFYGRGLAS